MASALVSHFPFLKYKLAIVLVPIRALISPYEKPLMQIKIHSHRNQDFLYVIYETMEYMKLANYQAERECSP